MNDKPRLPRRVGIRPLTVCQWTDRTPNATATARTALRQVLGPLGFSEERIDDVVFAVSELVANATEHAAGPYALRLRRTAGAYVCEVEDMDPRLPQIPEFSAAGHPGHAATVYAARLTQELHHLTQTAHAYRYATDHASCP
ncbi:ATP-binding protein [Streptomyces sp. BH105]|uniref:ATP-binding protein n=1 Tax=Streptomyces sp. BH105 TaxID=3410408 RepID=UPI003CE8ABF2